MSRPGLDYFGKMNVKDTQLGEIKTSYAHDQLVAYAQGLDDTLFVLSMAAIFGYDLPPAAYQSLYAQARSGALTNPMHELVPGDGVVWIASTQTIEVGQFLAKTAAGGDEQAQWRLLDGLLRAFGQYLDWLLRNRLSRVGANPQASMEPRAYALAMLDLEGAALTQYGLLIGEGGGPLKVSHDKLQQAIQRADKQSQRLQAQRTEALTNASYHDGVYRPDRDGPAFVVPVFDAQLNDGASPQGMFNHGSIESEGLGRVEPAYKPAEIAMIYYGNWLRDLSQLLDDGFLLPPGQTAKSWAKAAVNRDGFFSRESMSLALIALGEMRFTERFVAARAPIAFLDFIQLKPELLQEYMKRVGTYRPEEHIDNPTGLAKEYKCQLPRDWLVPVPFPAAALGVNPKSHLRTYIDTAVDAEHPCAVQYMSAQLTRAASLGRTPEGLMHFGNALHVLEDFYAHTNFIELTLYKLGYRDVITWVPKTLVFTDMPITTGVFQQQDQMFSLLYKLADMLAPLTEDAKRQSGRLVEGMPVRDWIMVRLLQDTGQPALAKVLRAYSRAGVWVDDKIERFVPDPIRDMNNWVRRTAYSYVNASIKSVAQSGARHEQLEGFDHDHSIDPTHTLIAKDGTDHPLHTLAAHLAIDAVADVGRVMQNVWSGKASVADAQRAAGSYFVHPADSGRYDVKVETWAKSDPQGLRVVSDREAMLERAKGHEHMPSEGEKLEPMPPVPSMPSMPTNWNPLPPGMWTQWNYLTDHYADLTNTQDALSQRLG